MSLYVCWIISYNLLQLKVLIFWIFCVFSVCGYCFPSNIYAFLSSSSFATSFSHCERILLKHNARFEIAYCLCICIKEKLYILKIAISTEIYWIMVCCMLFVLYLRTYKKGKPSFPFSLYVRIYYNIQLISFSLLIYILLFCIYE